MAVLINLTKVSTMTVHTTYILRVSKQNYDLTNVLKVDLPGELPEGLWETTKELPEQITKVCDLVGIDPHLDSDQAEYIEVKQAEVHRILFQDL